MGRNLVQGFLSIFGGKAGELTLSIIITPLLIRLLGSSSYGDYAFILSLQSILIIFINAGSFDGIRKFIAEKDDITWRREVFSFYLRMSIVLMVVVILPLLLVAEYSPVLDRIGERFKTYFFFLAFILISEQIYQILRSALQGFGREHYSETLLVVRRALFGVIGLTLVYTGGGVSGVLLGQILATSLVAVAAFIFLSSNISTEHLLMDLPDDFPRRKLISFNIHSIILILLLNSLYNVDIILLQLLVGSETTGYYKAALVIAEFLWFVPFAIQIILLHSTSELWANNQHERITSIATRAVRYALLLTLLLSMGLIALANPLVTLYFGSDFSSAVIPLLLLIPGALGFALARPLLAIGQGKGDLRILIWTTGIASSINIVLNLLLIPRYGMNGAAVATSVGYGSMFFLHVYSASRIGFNPLADLRLLRTAATAIGSAPLIIGLPYLFSSDLLALLIVPPIGLLAFSFLTIKTQAIDIAEVRAIIDKTPLQDGIINKLL